MALGNAERLIPKRDHHSKAHRKHFDWTLSDRDISRWYWNSKLHCCSRNSHKRFSPSACSCFYFSHNVFPCSRSAAATMRFSRILQAERFMVNVLWNGITHTIRYGHRYLRSRCYSRWYSLIVLLSIFLSPYSSSNVLGFCLLDTFSSRDAMVDLRTACSIISLVWKLKTISLTD